MMTNLPRQLVGVLGACTILLSPIAARSESTATGQDAQSANGPKLASEKPELPAAQSAPIVGENPAPSPSKASRFFGLTVSLGTSLGGAPLGGDYADFVAQYGGASQKLAGSGFLSGEFFVRDWVSVFGEVGFITFLEECGNCIPLPFGFKGAAIIRQRMIPITANARFSLPFAASSLYASLGTGVAPGDWDWDTENGSLLAVPLQVGSGYRHFFGSMFGLGLQAKYFYFVNTSALHYAKGTENASQRNVGVFGIYLDVFLL
jgi:hypothetical protein